jgi:hypothetical protein
VKDDCLTGLNLLVYSGKATLYIQQQEHVDGKALVDPQVSESRAKCGSYDCKVMYKTGPT